MNLNSESSYLVKHKITNPIVREIVETEVPSTPLTLIHGHYISCLCTGTYMISGGAKLEHDLLNFSITSVYVKINFAKTDMFLSNDCHVVFKRYKYIL